MQLRFPKRRFTPGQGQDTGLKRCGGMRCHAMWRNDHKLGRYPIPVEDVEDETAHKTLRLISPCALGRARVLCRCKSLISVYVLVSSMHGKVN